MLVPDDSLSTPESNLAPKDGSPLTVSSERSPQLYGNNNDYIPPPPPPSTARSPQLHPARSPQQQEVLLVSNATDTSFQSFQAPHTLPLSELNSYYAPGQELNHPEATDLPAYARTDSFPSLPAVPEVLSNGHQRTMNQDEHYFRQLQQQEEEHYYQTHQLHQQYQDQFSHENVQGPQLSSSSPSPRAYPIPDSGAGTVHYNNNNNNTSFSTAANGNVTFIPCEPLEGGSKFRDGRYTIRDFWFNMQNYRKKEFYIGLVVSLAIVLGILGGTVWNHHDNSSGNNSTGSSNNNNNNNNSGDRGSRGGVSNPGPSSWDSRSSSTVSSWTTTSTATVSFTAGPAPVEPTQGPSPPPKPQPPAPSPSPAPPPTPSPSGGGGGGGGGGSGDHQCQIDCGNIMSSCTAPCDSSPSYNQCVAACPSNDPYCKGFCSTSNQCFQDCSNAWSKCTDACPH